MPLRVRLMTMEDAHVFLEVHHAAVRETAARDYTRDVIEAWAPLPITEEAVLAVQSNPDGERRFVAEIDGEVVGIAALVAANAELRACYVLPVVARSGVGTALVRELERVARGEGLSYLVLDSSITAEPFYLARGYTVVGRGEHVLRNGGRMACVKMRKSLA